METTLTEVTLRSIEALKTLSSHDKNATKIAKHLEDIFSGMPHGVVTAEAKIRTDCSVAEFGMTVEFGADEKNYLSVVYANNSRVAVNYELVGYGKVSRNKVADAVRNAG